MRLTIRDLKHEIGQGLAKTIPPHCYRLTQVGGGVRIQLVLRDRLIDEHVYCSGGIAAARMLVDQLKRMWEISRENHPGPALDEHAGAGSGPSRSRQAPQ